MLKTMAFLFTFYCRLSGRCITLLFSFLSCGGSNHCLTRPPTKTILLSALFFIRQRLHRAFVTTSISSASRPNFSIKAVTGINEVWPHLHSKLIWLFVMVANLVMLLLCSGKSRNNSSDFYLFNVTKSDTLSNSISGRLWWANVCAAYRQDLEPFLCFLCFSQPIIQAKQFGIIKSHWPVLYQKFTPHQNMLIRQLSLVLLRIKPPFKLIHV